MNKSRVLKEMLIPGPSHTRGSLPNSRKMMLPPPPPFRCSSIKFTSMTAKRIMWIKPLYNHYITTVSFTHLSRCRGSLWFVPDLFKWKCCLALSYCKYSFAKLTANATKTKIKYRKNLAASISILMKACSSGPVLELAWINDRFCAKANRIATEKTQYETSMVAYPRSWAWLSHFIDRG